MASTRAAQSRPSAMAVTTKEAPRRQSPQAYKLLQGASSALGAAEAWRVLGGVKSKGWKLKVDKLYYSWGHDVFFLVGLSWLSAS